MLGRRRAGLPATGRPRRQATLRPKDLLNEPFAEVAPEGKWLIKCWSRSDVPIEPRGQPLRFRVSSIHQSAKFITRSSPQDGEQLTQFVFRVLPIPQSLG